MSNTWEAGRQTGGGRLKGQSACHRRGMPMAPAQPACTRPNVCAHQTGTPSAAQGSSAPPPPTHLPLLEQARLHASHQHPHLALRQGVQDGHLHPGGWLRGGWVREGRTGWAGTCMVAGGLTATFCCRGAGGGGGVQLPCTPARAPSLPSACWLPGKWTCPSAAPCAALHSARPPHSRPTAHQSRAWAAGRQSRPSQPRRPHPPRRPARHGRPMAAAWADVGVECTARHGWLNPERLHYIS